MSTGPDVQAAFVATIVDEWVRGGVTDAVVAPGSRSTPVVAALAADGRIRLHVVLDERAGAFTALGLGLASGRPAPMVTTSGTAAVEVHPAVVEAHQAQVPMIVVTADRPAELHHVGAPQTVEQVGLYPGALRWAANPGVADAAAAGTWRGLAARTVIDAAHHPAGPGPVHLNLELREPLLGRADALPDGRPAGAAWHTVGGVAPRPASPGTVALLAARAGTDGIIVAGAGAPDAADVLALAEALGWPVLADPRSGCRVRHDLVIAAADSLLRSPRVVSMRPTAVLRLGRPWASKVLNQWLAGLGPATTQVVVDPWGTWVDPDRTAEIIDRGDAGLLCHLVVERVGEGSVGPSAWASGWISAERAAQDAIDAHLDSVVVPTEAAVARRVVGALRDGATLFASSSMPVRDVEWWGAPRGRLSVLANRGANGIDGIVSTALGVALGSDGPVTCLTGDLAFLYDAGALLGAAARPVSLTYVVIDNDGGGIFSFLPQATVLPPERLERLWSTPHGLDLLAVARAYGVDARSVTDLSDLGASLAAPVTGVRVLVVRTDRAANVVAHAALDAAVVAAVEGLPSS